MNFSRTLAIGVTVFFLSSGALTVYGQSSGRGSREDVSHADAASGGASALGDVDRLLQEFSSLLPVIARCVERQSRLRAEVDELPRADTRIPPPIVAFFPEKIGRLCGDDFSMERVIEEFHNVEIVWSNRLTVMRRLMQYYQCKSMAEGSPSPCRKLATFTHSKMRIGITAPGADEKCSDLYHHSALAKAIITNSPGAGDMCDGMCGMSQDSRPIEGGFGECARMCRLMIEHRDAPEAVCANASAGLWRSARIYGAKDCKDSNFLFLFGAPIDCFEVKRPRRESCLAHAAFKNAHQAINMGLCADLPLCQVMMGAGPETCEATAQRLKMEFCQGQRVKQAELEARSRFLGLQAERADALAKLQAKAARLEASCLETFGDSAALNNKIDARLSVVPVGTPGLRKRRERLSRLASQRVELEEKYGAAKVPRSGARYE